MFVADLTTDIFLFMVFHSSSFFLWHKVDSIEDIIWEQEIDGSFEHFTYIRQKNKNY